MTVFTRIEYGVIVDRTSKGLGYYLAYLSASLPIAQLQAESWGEEYPVEIKQRSVTTGEWESVG